MDYSWGITDWEQWMKKHHVKLGNRIEADQRKNRQDIDRVIRIYKNENGRRIQK